MIKLIALDLDGTLFSEDLIIAAPVRAALAAAQAQGVHVTLASGRMIRSMRPIAADLRIDVPLIGYQGAVVYDVQAGQYLLHYRLPRDLALRVIDFVQARGYFCNAYIDDSLYVAAINPASEYYSRLNAGIPMNPVGDLHAFVAAAEHPPTKLSVVLANEATTDVLLAAMKAQFGAELYAVKSYPLFAEGVNPDANKAVALAALAAHLGIEQAETMAIGDGQNDLHMLQWAGVGVAMGQARQNVKDAADYVTASITDNGVAAAIDRFVLNGVQPAHSS